MRYIAEDATLRFKFTTRQFSTGAPYTLAGTPSLSVYPEDSATQITTGITLTADYDSKTGLNNVVIDLSASASYAAGKKYEVVIEAGTVDSVSVVGEVVYEFYIHASGGLEALITRGLLALPAVAPDSSGGLPTEDASGHIAADVREWLGTAVTVSSTTAKPQVDVDSIDDDATAANNAEAFFDGTGYAGTNNVIPSVTTVTGNVDGSVASVTAGVTLANGAITDASLAGNMEIVFETDFATNYNTTRNAWATNVQDTVGSGTLGLTIPTAANIVDEWESQSQADPTGFHVNVKELDGSAIQQSSGVIKSQLADGVVHGGTSATVRLGASGTTPAFYATNSGGIAFQALSTSAADGHHGAMFSSLGTNNYGLSLYGSQGGLGSDGLFQGAEITNGLVADITGSLSGSVGSVTGAVGSVTGNVGGSVASVTAGVNLADDAITSDKFDESTAFPLASVDSGSTAVARTGADADTLETLSDEIAAIPTSNPSAAAISTQVASDLASAHGAGSWITATNVTVSDKTGFKLASDGLDSISTTAPSGVASNFREMLVQLYRRFFKRTTKDSDEIKTYADDGTTVITTQSYTVAGDNEDVGAAS